MSAARAAAALAVALTSAGCLMLAPRPDMRPGVGRERTVVISLEGTPGLAFEGSYGTPARSTAARGVVPAQFSVTTTVAVVAMFTKTDQDGELVVRVLVDGQEVQRRGTTQPFGSVIVNQQLAP
ncbi:MAG: hypothetical protein QN178_02300 [Armatimonadota bacterium]|nr:hypothetical protein [Armatimonadota bacterium]